MSGSIARITPRLLPLALWAAMPAIAAAQGVGFYTVTPCRVVDTRAAVGPFGAPALQAGTPRAFTLAGQCGITTSAVAVSINLAVVAPSGAGSLNVYPVGIAPPATSAINFNVGSTRANNAIVALGAGGGIVVPAGMASGAVDVIIDVNGYFDALAPGAVAPPAMTPPPASYEGAQYVSLASSTPGTSIRYTLDGSAPTYATGTLFDGTPIKLLGNTTVRAVAFTGPSAVSTVAGGEYTIVLEDLLFLATLRPQNGATTLGAGSASLVLAGDQTTARLYETYSNLTGDLIGQHIHEADGSIVFDVDEASVEADGSRVWTLVPVGTFTPAQLVADLFAGKLYLNLHTVQYPSGEIKGFFQLATGSQTFTPPPPPPPLPPPPPTARDAARFLAQATFGATPSEIPALQAQGFDSWLNAQFATPASPTTADLDALTAGGVTPVMNDFWDAFWKRAVTGNDQLRERVALALSEIFVTSAADSTLNGRPYGMSTYYDLLARDAFGNFRQLLQDVTLSATMGVYLDMLRNDKENPLTGRIPNENYAREILQLFSVGLYQLFPDGTLKLGGTGLPQATYDQSTVIGFSHVFTGWSWGNNPITETAWRNPTQYTWTYPMQVWPAHHSTGSKSLLRGVVLPAGQAPETDLAQALDNIFSDPNVGPFLCRGLIQRLVTSNPSPAYIYRCGQAFENNGAGVRGDLSAVVRAILLDYEARAEALTQKAGYGKEREPMLRLATLLRTFRATSPSGKYPFHNLDDPATRLGQTPLRSPTVFNFFAPDYVLPGVTAEAGLYAPEFEITTVVQAIGSANYLRNLIYNGVGSGVDKVTPSFADFLPFAGGADTGPLVDQLNLALTAQGLPASARAIMVTALNQLPASNPTNRVKAAIRLFMMSPSWIVQK